MDMMKLKNSKQINKKKVIFVNLTFNTAIENLLIPDGILEQLIEKRNKDTQIVITTLEGFKKVLGSYGEHEGVMIEYIKKIPPSGVLQKAFQFFYSYLIFTGTTKTLATFGARADVPPAGGNRHMAFLKNATSKTFGRSKFIKTKFVPWAFKKIFRKRPYKDLFDKYNPDLVFVSNIAFFPDQELVAEAGRRGIKTIGMACNWDHLNKYFIPMHSDFLIVQNEPMQKEAIDLHSYNKHQIFISGFPQFDMHANYKDWIIPKDEFLKKFNIPEGKKIILFISGAAYALDEPDILKEISKWIKNGRFDDETHLVIRPYVVGRDKSNEEKKYKDLMDKPNISFNWLMNEHDIENKKYYLSMLYYSDVVISVFSTSAIEAAFFDKPMLTLGFDGHIKRPPHQSITRLEKMSHFKHVLDTGSVKVAKSFNDLYDGINSYLLDPAKDREKRKILVDKMCYRVDSKSSERITYFILEKIDGK